MPKVLTNPYPKVGCRDTGLDGWWVVSVQKSAPITPHCSECKGPMLLDTNKHRLESNYCPHCGARMIGKRLIDYTED